MRIAVVDLWTRTGQARSGISARLGRLARLPRADWGKAVAHSGLGITMLGIAMLTANEVEDIRVAQIGAPFEVAGYEITLDAVEELQGPNYLTTMATMTVRQGGAVAAVLHPEKRVYPVQAMPTTEADIDNGLFRDVYLVIGDRQDGGGWAVRTYIKPFTSWIWAGAALMALGGFLSLSDRRYRVAAGARKTAALQATPAE